MINMMKGKEDANGKKTIEDDDGLVNINHRSNGERDL